MSAGERTRARGRVSSDGLWFHGTPSDARNKQPRRAPEKRVAVAYIRVSTRKQEQDGLGLEVQGEAMRERLPSTRIYVEQGSGADDLGKRKVLAEIDARIRAGEISSVWVYRLDRLARDVFLQELLIVQWKEHGCEVRALFGVDGVEDDDDPSRTMLRQIMGAVGQYERAIIRMRTKAGRRIKASRGGYVGGAAPYGWRIDKRIEGDKVIRELVPVEAEQRAVARVLEMRAEGLSFMKIATALNAEEHPPRGKAWHPKGVRAIALRG